MYFWEFITSREMIVVYIVCILGIFGIVMLDKYVEVECEGYYYTPIYINGNMILIPNKCPEKVNK